MTQAPHHAATMDEQGQRLLKLLVSRLPNVKPNDPRTFISYKQIHDVLNLPQLGPTLGASLQHQGLNSLAEWTASSGKPGITGLIIDKGKLTPGPGYFKLYSRDPEDFQWWLAEIQKSKDFDWSPYLSSYEDQTSTAAGKDWTEDELRASVIAYLEMQRQHHASTPFTKKKYYEALSEEFGRTAKAFEYRMQNISYVLSLMGRDWLTGLKPAKNVGVNTAAQIEALIAEVEGKAIAPVVAFEIAVREEISKKELPLPKGSQAPKSVVTSVTQFQRDASVKAWVLKAAGGVCECCQQPAPFNGVDDLPYLEVHHVRKLAENGSDTISNAIAACPNCHRALHYGMHAKDLIDGLYQRVARLKRE